MLPIMVHEPFRWVEEFPWDKGAFKPTTTSSQGWPGLSLSEQAFGWLPFRFGIGSRR